MENNIENTNDEITTREIIQISKKYLKLFWVKKLWGILIIAVLSAFMAYKFLKFTPEFEAPLTFMINEESSSGSAVSGLLGQFGFGGSSNQFNKKKVNFLIKTYKIQEDALFDTVQYKNQDGLLINQIIETYSLDKKWAKKNQDLLGFRFKSKLGNDEHQLTAFKKTFDFLNDENNKIINTSLNDDTGIYTIKIKTTDPELSMNLANHLYSSLSKFYVNQAIERQSVANKVLKEKVDSIEDQMSRTNYSIANYKDRSKSTWSSRADVSVQNLEQDRIKLATIYSEAVKSYEMSNYNLKSQTPVFQIVDKPMNPLEPSRFGIFKQLITVIVGSLFIYFLIVVLNQIYIENS